MKTKKDIPPIDKEQAIEGFIKGAKDEQIKNGVVPIDNTGTSLQPDTGTEPSPDMQPNTPTGTSTVTSTGTPTGTLLDTLMEPSENYVRKVYYIYEHQDEFILNMIKKASKKKKIKESEIVRIALDYFINSNGKEW